MHKGINTTRDEGQTPVLAPQAFYSNESRCDGIPVPDLAPPLKVGSNGGGQPPAVAFSAKDHGGDASEEVAPTMRSMGHDGSHANGGGQLAVAFKPSHFTRGKDGKPSEVTPPLSADADKGGQDTVIAQSYSIRADAMREGVAKTPSPDAEGRVRLRDPGMGVYEEVAPTMDTGQPHGVAFVKSKRAQSTTDDESWVPGEVAPTFNCFDQGDTRATTVVAFTQNSRDEVRQINGDGQLAGALSAEAGMHQTNYIAFANRTRDGIKVPEVMKDGVTPALTNPGDGGRSDAVNVVVPQPLAVRTAQTSANGHGVSEGVCHTLDQAQGQAVMTPMAVRRLTPRECERLQGFPDDYTAIEYRKKPAADGPRYKALGNSMAVPVMAWIGKRINAVDELRS